MTKKVRSATRVTPECVKYCAPPNTRYLDIACLCQSQLRVKVHHAELHLALVKAVREISPPRYE